MVRRGDLLATEQEVLGGRFCTDGTVLIECRCGRGMIRTDDASERGYALHVATALGIKLVHR